MEYRYNKFRIYPNKEQSLQIQNNFGCVRFVYNHFLDARKTSYVNTGKSPTRFQQDKLLPELKKKYPWLQAADCTSLKVAVKQLDGAYRNFFRSIKQGKHIGYPKFKSKKKNIKKYTSNSKAIRIIDEKHIQLPKLGYVRCIISKQIRGRIIYATISQSRSGKYYVAICYTVVKSETLLSTGAAVGVDLGLKDLATTNYGEKYKAYRCSDLVKKKLIRLHRRLSRKSRGSNRYEKTRLQLAKLYEHIVNQRRDNMHKITTDLIRKYDLICIENLNVYGMLKNHHVARAMSETALYEFRHQLEYKAKWYGRTIKVIEKFYPSSQICSNCGNQWSGTKDLSIRKWTCPKCGILLDRDINAAQNILNEGLHLSL